MHKVTNSEPGPRGFYVVQTGKDDLGKDAITGRTLHTVEPGKTISVEIPADQAKKLHGKHGLSFEAVNGDAEEDKAENRTQTGGDAPVLEVKKFGRQYCVVLGDQVQSELKNKAGAEADLKALQANAS